MNINIKLKTNMTCPFKSMCSCILPSLSGPEKLTSLLIFSSRCLHAAILHHACVLWHSTLLPRALLWSVCQLGLFGGLEDQPHV